MRRFGQNNERKICQEKRNNFLTVHRKEKKIKLIDHHIVSALLRT